MNDSITRKALKVNHYLTVPVRMRVDMETDLPMRLSAIGLARTAVVEMWLHYMAEM